MRFIILFLPFSANALCFFGPCNYEECLTEYVVSAKTELAAKALAATCNEEFRMNSEAWERRKDNAECKRDVLPTVENTISAKAAIIACNKSNPVNPLKSSLLKQPPAKPVRLLSISENRELQKAIRKTEEARQDQIISDWQRKIKESNCDMAHNGALSSGLRKELAKDCD